MRTTDELAFNSRIDRLRKQVPSSAEISDTANFLSALRKNARTFRAGSKLTFEGDEVHSVMCVLSGWIVVSKSLPDGQTQIIDFILPGDIVSPTGADGMSSAWQVEALTDVTLAILNTSEWSAMQKSWPGLHDLEATLAAAARARISERMLRLGRGSAPMRVAYALLELGVRLKSIHENNSTQFHVPLTQQRLGEFAGLSSVHVCRTLRRLVRHNIISTKDHMDIHINDLDALAGLAGVQISQLRKEIEPKKV